MKGLHGGIPLAVLAATARAQVQVIGGPGGVDVGNHASIPTENTATTTVNEDFKDDHSFELEHEVKVYPPGHGHHKRVARGSSGDDIGNAFGAATVNSFSSEVNEAYKDDHSVDIDKTTIVKPHHHRRGDIFPEVPAKPTVVGEPSGDDIGNVADIPTLNEFTSSVTTAYFDDHSVDVDKNTIIKPHSRRQHVSVIDAPGGDDVGNAAFLADVNKLSSSFTGKYKDDHSVDIDKTTIIEPDSHHGKKHPGPGFHHPPKHEARSDRAPVIGGPSGDDIGNVADIPTVNSFTGIFNGKYQDDHSVDVDKTFIVKPHKARAVRPGHDDDNDDDDEEEEEITVFGGPRGDDVGNGFAAVSVNTVNTETNESVNDDHSVKVHETEVIHPGGDHIHPIKPHPEGHGTQTPVDHSGAQEPAPPAPAQHEWEPESDSECTKVHQVVHTVTSTRTAVETATHTAWPQPAHSESQQSSSNQYPAAGTPSSPHGHEQAPAAPQDESEHDSSNHNYPETGSGWSKSPAPEQSADSDNNHNHPETDSSWSNSQAPEQSSDAEYAHGQQETPAPQYENEHGSSSSDSQAGSSWSDSHNPAQSQYSGQSGASPEHQAPSQNQGQDKSGEWSSPSYSNEQDSHDASPEPAVSEVYYGAQSSHADWQSTPTGASHGSHAGASSHMQYQPSPTAPGAYHAPGPAITAAEASSFSVVPVFVPSGNPWAHEHGSVVVASSDKPASSAFRVHGAAVPTGASAEQRHRPSPSPSPSTHEIEFTGGAGRIAKIEGFCGVLAGVFTLLAFAL
ncbi:hypothetical protein BDV10DRAFT_191806 [Aspergillus recurvatus]